MTGSALTNLLGLRFPLLQAGMGGIAGPDLTAAVSEAGAGGVLALYRLPPDEVFARIRTTRALTRHPFGVNLIPELHSLPALHAQVAAALQASDEHVFFTFYGLPDETTSATLRRAGRRQLTMVGDENALRRAIELKVDAVIVQGIEAGGHLLGHQTLDALLDRALRIIDGRLPVLASGGIGDGRRLRRLVARGSSGGLCGTLFVATEESEAHPLYKRRLLESTPVDTVVTGLFEHGWPARRHRVLRNALTEAVGEPFPARFIASIAALGRRHPLPRYSAMVPTVHTCGRIDEMAMYCGESVAAVSRVLPAADCVARLVTEYEAAVEDEEMHDGAE